MTRDADIARLVAQRVALDKLVPCGVFGAGCIMREDCLRGGICGNCEPCPLGLKEGKRMIPENNCRNCKFGDLHISDSPCNACFDFRKNGGEPFTLWEAE